MDFDGFDWDGGNREKCQKHGVTSVEIESLFEGEPRVGPDPRHSVNEQRFAAAGRTASAKALFVVFTWRIRAGRRMIRPISASYMHKKEIDGYEEALPRFQNR